MANEQKLNTNISDFTKTYSPKPEIAINTYRPGDGATAQPKAPTTGQHKPSPPPSKND